MRARLRFPAAGCLGVAWASLLLLSVVQRGDGEARARYIEVYEPFPFTPDGSRLQLQHAQQAAKKGSLSLGIVARDGVVLAAESRLPSPLVVGSSKMGRIDKHLAYVMSGISADGRYLVKRARVLAQRHWFDYGEQMGLPALLFELAKIVTLGERRLKREAKSLFDDLRSQPTIDPHAELETDLDKDPLPARHFGVGFLFAGRSPLPHGSLGSSDQEEEEGAGRACWCLYELEPTGIFTRWEARAIGEACERAEALLDQECRPMMGLAEAQRAAVHVMDTVLDGVNGSANDAERRVELAVLTRQDDGHVILRRLSSEEVAALREQVKNRRGLTAGPPPPPSSSKEEEGE